MITKQGKQFLVTFTVNEKQVIELLDRGRDMGVKPTRFPPNPPISVKIPDTKPGRLAASKKKTVKEAGK